MKSKKVEFFNMLEKEPTKKDGKIIGIFDYKRKGVVGSKLKAVVCRWYEEDVKSWCVVGDYMWEKNPTKIDINKMVAWCSYYDVDVLSLEFMGHIKKRSNEREKIFESKFKLDFQAVEKRRGEMYDFLIIIGLSLLILWIFNKEG